MAVAVIEAQSASAVAASSVTTPTITPSGNDRILLAFGGNSDAVNAPEAYTDMTYAAGQMVPKWNLIGAVYLRNVCEYLLNPSTAGGAVTYTLNAVDTVLSVAAIALSGVDQSNPLGTEVGNAVGGGTAEVTVTVPSEPGDLVVDHFFGGGTVIAVSQGNTSRAEQENIGAAASMGISTEAGAASVITGWTRTGTALAASVVGVNVNASRSAGNGRASKGRRSLSLTRGML